MTKIDDGAQYLPVNQKCTDIEEIKTIYQIEEILEDYGNKNNLFKR
jgi:hypothetical protein